MQEAAAGPPELSWEELDELRERSGEGEPPSSLAFYRSLLGLRQMQGGHPGSAPTDEVMREAGEVAGRLLFNRFLADAGTIYSLIRELSSFVKAAGIAILRMEECDEAGHHFVFTTLRDLDRSRLSIAGQGEGAFEEGLFGGVLGGFYGRGMEARRVECWGKDRRICRYEATASVAAPQRPRLV